MSFLGLVEPPNFQMLSDVGVNLGLKLHLAEIVRRHFEDVIELTNVFVN
jgi:hypothetical protein